MPDPTPTPAVIAAEEAQRAIEACIDGGEHFLVEAGAGAGKTHSLVEAIRYVIRKQGQTLLRDRQQVACITYTNVAADEIADRIDKSPVVFSSTIHSFCWNLVRDFQPTLRQLLPGISRWSERIAESGDIATKPIEYNLGYPKIEADRVLLQHNDVLALMVAMMEYPKFRARLAARFPIVFIDEYQDTDKELAGAIKKHILDPHHKPLIGLFGDHWQRIYPAGCGAINSVHLRVIGKKANFRSVPAVVNVLNRIRVELPQEVHDPNGQGTAQVFHTNQWNGQRRTDSRWEGDLPVDAAERHLRQLRGTLEHEGWDFQGGKTKILMLTHRLLAAQQGYSTIADVFDQSDAYVQKVDPHMAFLLDTVEPMCEAFEHKRYGEMFAVLGGRLPAIENRGAKEVWARDMSRLLEARSSGTIGSVLDVLKTTGRPAIPEAVARREQILQAADDAVDEDERETIRALRQVPYEQVKSLGRFVEEETPFATKHGVKGAEFENVLVVVGRGGWNQYNFNQYLEWAANPDGVPERNKGAYERNRNLFYVACSRPEKRLAVLFVQQLSGAALTTLRTWFSDEAVRPLVLTE